ncbi:Oxygen-insensitive NAD(P)H nitroreductase [Mycobacteroides abscessus subsp. bolletii]|uniref:nitroreductase family protein n=1 Tax=Mycobacteroides abscessus TaxID=36809 RepID=UPI00078CD22B|nr:nitroreductase family protein [Mycobacteroides abscessus]AMU22066.1 NAD(P)H-dependent oxidoreductase [Mycobacteroides abscessus]SHY90002.1 Oxygen-insensitive NAD(P)H nitroreductase [Mycobacteroides abscessus subsp. bolletii]SKQ57661.1 Oxygen-insensitive NAD(P)H nitroreductase [Mycobacteroides abscessus subsp. bolletii]SKQ59768.1 Oxygen-insensitive NAD(P)H nitroreductase [Mycobacteroides abscessus subsp. bolletii]SKQ62386.1 Oxygen-insensitive NAD(P)H nitroreductase [Mycobacteroides abscessus
MKLDNLMGKHLTRYFDSSKTIPAESLQQLLRFLRTVPSSVNVQASRYYVLGTPEGKERLAGSLGERFLDNGAKIRDASHVLIFTTRVDVPDSHLEEVFGKEKADGRFPDPAKQLRWESMTREFLKLRTYGYKDVAHWLEKQTYLALGMTMMAAAELGFDATPLEGFEPAGVDAAFKTRETGYTTTVLLALGYPDIVNTYSNPISRLDHDRLFSFA